jgi:polysaccharide deacetylase 2 family uncharacterized protein YibQ
MRFAPLVGPVTAALAATALLVNLYFAVPQRGPDSDLAGIVVPVDPAEDAASHEGTDREGGSAAGTATDLAEAAAEPQAARAIDTEWERRAVPVVLRAGLAAVAIVIDDIGIDRARAMQAIRLPAPLTLSFLPYGRDAPALAILARQRGHEILLHMPMQAVGGENPGPHALTTDLAAVEIRARVGAALDRFGDAVGLNNHMGSRFTSERRLVIPVVEELRARGLVFVDSRTTPNSQGVPAAEEVGLPSAMRDVFLDNDLAPEAITKQFEELERIARRRGYAVAIGHPHDATLAALAGWLPRVAERGIQVVPVSAIVRRTVERSRPRP